MVIYAVGPPKMKHSLRLTATPRINVSFMLEVMVDSLIWVCNTLDSSTKAF